MAKVILKHQTADGVVHTRKTARTYSHVIVATNTVSGKTECPSWVGRPDLVASALGAYSRAGILGWAYQAEPINNGERVPA